MRLLSRLLLVAAAACAAAGSCPPPNFSTVENFSLADYISAPCACRLPAPLRPHRVPRLL